MQNHPRAHQLSQVIMSLDFVFSPRSWGELGHVSSHKLKALNHPSGFNVASQTHWSPKWTRAIWKMLFLSFSPEHCDLTGSWWELVGAGGMIPGNFYWFGVLALYCLFIIFFVCFYSPRVFQVTIMSNRFWSNRLPHPVGFIFHLLGMAGRQCNSNSGNVQL